MTPTGTATGSPAPSINRSRADGRSYPQQWEADVVASEGGIVHLRPILPSDATALLAFHEQLSERAPPV